MDPAEIAKRSEIESNETAEESLKTNEGKLGSSPLLPHLSTNCSGKAKKNFDPVVSVSLLTKSDT